MIQTSRKKYLAEKANEAWGLNTWGDSSTTALQASLKPLSRTTKLALTFPGAERSTWPTGLTGLCPPLGPMISKLPCSQQWIRAVPYDTATKLQVAKGDSRSIPKYLRNNTDCRIPDSKSPLPLKMTQTAQFLKRRVWARTGDKRKTYWIFLAELNHESNFFNRTTQPTKERSTKPFHLLSHSSWLIAPSGDRVIAIPPKYHQKDVYLLQVNQPPRGLFYTFNLFSPHNYSPFFPVHSSIIWQHKACT